MRKVIWTLMILCAVGVIVYFIGVPYLSSYLRDNHPELLERFGIYVAEAVNDDFLAAYSDSAEGIAVKEGWTAPEKIEYQARDIPSLEKDFIAVGYPDFRYVMDDMGNLNQKGEKSFREEDGAMVFLYMNDAYYLTSARIEFETPRDKFNSTSMNEHIDLYLDFIRIITSREVTETDKNVLLRVFTNVFNDRESKNNTVSINGLEFQVSLDVFNRLIILEC